MQYRTGGDVESMQEVFSDLFLAIAMALILVYMVMACQFESLWNPLLIMASVPVMFIGVFPGLFITGQRISMMSLLGVLMLEGIVVNNAIVLIDYIQQLRAKGLCKREAVVEAGRTRMRPISGDHTDHHSGYDPDAAERSRGRGSVPAYGSYRYFRAGLLHHYQSAGDSDLI